MNLNNIDLNKLVVFCKVVEASNYRLAAELLNVTPSALSQSIAALEHGLGFPLFHRFGKKLVLTEEGTLVYQEFSADYERLTAALLSISSKGKSVSGLLRIGAYLEFAKFRLTPLLRQFQETYPDVQIKFVFDTPSRLHRLLDNNKIDICFSIYPERDSKLILSKPIFREELVLIGASKLIKDKLLYEELIKVPMIEYYFNHQPIRRWIALHYKKKPKHLPIRTYGATAEMVLSLVQEGLGVGVIPEYLLQGRSVDKLTVCRPTSRQLIDHIWMLQLKNKRPSNALEAFTAAINTSTSLLGANR